MNNEFDQQLAMVRDSLPRYWWSIYQGCLTVGFSDRQVMLLVQTYMMTTQLRNVNLPQPEDGPKSDENK